MRLARRLGMVAVVAATLLASAIPAAAHQGYHHNGAQSAGQHWGAWMKVEVTNPGVRRPYDEFVAARILAKQSGTWLEAGWVEHGLEDTNKYIYTFTQADPGWDFYPQYSISTGNTVQIRVWPSTYCTSSAPCVWRSAIYWGGQWQALKIQSLPINYSAYFEEYAEVYSAFTGHLSIAQCCDGTGGALNFLETWLRQSFNGSWVHWTYLSVPGEVEPYYVTWLQNYWDWYAYQIL